MKPNTTKRWLLLLTLPGCCAAAHAADTPPDTGGSAGSPGAQSGGDKSGGDKSGGELTPDRPGFTNGSDTVTPGHVQIEGGVTRTKTLADSGGVRSTDGPQILVRTGLNDRTELRFTLPDYITQGTASNLAGTGSGSGGGGQSGFSDGSVGLRYKLYQSKDGNTKVALTPSLSIPVKSAVTVSGHVDPVFSLNGQTQSGARWGLSSNLILSYPTQQGRRVTDYTATGQVTYALSGPLAVFGDFYYDAPVGGPPSPIADGGFTYRVAKNVQLDLETGRGTGGAAPVQFYGGGVAVRF